MPSERNIIIIGQEKNLSCAYAVALQYALSDNNMIKNAIQSTADRAEIEHCTNILQAGKTAALQECVKQNWSMEYRYEIPAAVIHFWCYCTESLDSHSELPPENAGIDGIIFLAAAEGWHQWDTILLWLHAQNLVQRETRMALLCLGRNELQVRIQQYDKDADSTSLSIPVGESYRDGRKLDAGDIDMNVKQNLRQRLARDYDFVSLNLKVQLLAEDRVLEDAPNIQWFVADLFQTEVSGEEYFAASDNFEEAFLWMLASFGLYPSV